MSRIIRGKIQNSLYQTKNKEEVKNWEIRYLPDLSIINLLFSFGLVQRILNYFPNNPTHCLYFGEVETPYYRQNLPRFTQNIDYSQKHFLCIRAQKNTFLSAILLKFNLRHWISSSSVWMHLFNANVVTTWFFANYWRKLKKNLPKASFF